jgi:thioredoxin 1
MSDHVINVNDQDFAQAVLDSDLPVLVDFWADWCGPCHIVAPVVEEIAREHAGTVRVAKLNVDENPYTAQQYGVLSIPTLILFSRGEEQGRVLRGPKQGFHRADAPAGRGGVGASTQANPREEKHPAVKS